jgi:hypothetical protein
LFLGRGITWESFQEEGNVEEEKERLNRSKIGEKVTGRLWRIRRLLSPSGPVELEELLRRAFDRTSGVMWRK